MSNCFILIQIPLKFIPEIPVDSIIIGSDTGLVQNGQQAIISTYDGLF